MRLRQREQIVVAAQVARAMLAVFVILVRIAAVAETLAAIAVFVERVRLQHRSHGAVEQENAPGERLFQLGDPVRIEKRQCVHIGFLANKLNTSKCGGRASQATFAQCSTSSPALRAKPINSSRLKPRLRWSNGATAARWACFASVAASRRPAGLSTRAASASALAGCWLYVSACIINTRSKRRLPRSSACMSPSITSTFRNDFSRARAAATTR